MVVLGHNFQDSHQISVLTANNVIHYSKYGKVIIEYCGMENFPIIK